MIDAAINAMPASAVMTVRRNPRLNLANPRHQTTQMNPNTSTAQIKNATTKDWSISVMVRLY